MIFYICIISFKKSAEFSGDMAYGMSIIIHVTNLNGKINVVIFCQNAKNKSHSLGINN